MSRKRNEDEGKEELEISDEVAKKRKNLKSWLTGELRRVSFRWPPRNDCIKAARVDRGRYKCNMCGSIVKSKEFSVDHIHPIINLKDGFPFRPDGLPDWNVFIDRLFCEQDGWQVLCNPCHDSKTSVEDTMRAHFNKLRKEEQKRLTLEAKKNKIKE